MRTRFEWDRARAAGNLHRHQISFEIAVRVFSDSLAVVDQDRVEGKERRCQTLEMVEGNVLPLVGHTVREEGDADVIRIISTRRAEPKERRRYEQENR